ncbi:hypothetical protein yc1106_05589 [Curvularia clavata]|uniref:Uncharacterized protein n=1 Tax=Curvularia clavata TaxID=95742 RepID=A0A9Q8Z9U7_CURCL|nr:hypothetical protein yc1106_05589 [Curvularia clavata]
MQTGRRNHPNRQPRSNASSDRGRGRGQGRGTSSSHRGGRGDTNHHSNRNFRPSQAYSPVPAHSSIHPGTPVSLVLKQDQPTGHRVAGIVAELLTRGDHPRGVKVRLRDGRVGRVQSLISQSDGEAGEALVGGPEAGLGRDGEAGGARVRGRMLGVRVERDVREGDEYFYDESRQQPLADTGLFAALEEADRRHEERLGGGGREETAVCPVCGEFEGDEIAVARHVEGHFTE